MNEIWKKNWWFIILKDEIEARNELRRFIKKHYPDWKEEFDLVEEGHEELTLLEKVAEFAITMLRKEGCSRESFKKMIDRICNEVPKGKGEPRGFKVTGEKDGSSY